MLEQYEHIFNEINYKISTTDKLESINDLLEELRKLYLEVLYYIPTVDSVYKQRRYLLEYYTVIRDKGQRRLNG